MVYEGEVSERWYLIQRVEFENGVHVRQPGAGQQIGA